MSESRIVRIEPEDDKAAGPTVARHGEMDDLSVTRCEMDSLSAMGPPRAEEHL